MAKVGAGPDTTSSDYDASIGYWQQAHDLIEGVEAMRAGGQRYLPMLPDECISSYEYRRRHARYTNIFADIVTNLAAKPLRRELTIRDGTATEKVEALCEDIDGAGNSLHVFAANAFLSGIAKGLDWIMVDFTRMRPRPDGRPLTIAEEQAQGARPYWVHISAENLLAVRSDRFGGQEQVVHARIREGQIERDGFAEVYVERIRVLNREPIVDSLGRVLRYGPATWELWERAANQPRGRAGAWEIVDQGDFSLGVIPLVPFVAGRRKGGSWQVIPPLKGAADLAVEHYQAENNLKHIKELTAFPMLSASGVQPEVQAGKVVPVRVGPSAVLYAPPGPDGSRGGEWKFVEPECKSLQFLADDIKATEQQIRELGRQPLTAQTGNLTVVTTAFAASKANSVIAAWALNLKDALEQALALTAAWLNDPSQPEVVIAEDVDDALLGDQSAEALLATRKAGDLSRETTWAELKRRGVLAAEFDPETERERLDAEAEEGLLDDDHHLAAMTPPLRLASVRGAPSKEIDA